VDIKAELQRRVATALAAVAGEHTVPNISMERPKVSEHGDYASNIALMMAKSLGRNPMEVAEAIRSHLTLDGTLRKVEVARPGFLNFFVAEQSLADALHRILKEGDGYGRSTLMAGQRVLVEFVSANPTGPLHTGHARNAVVGDCICRTLQMAGATVQREYYFNDAGAQIQRLGESVKARYLQFFQPELPFPEDGYHGNYIREIAQSLRDQYGDSWTGRDELDFARHAEAIVVELINDDLVRMGITFDSRISETQFHDQGDVVRCADTLEKVGAAYLNDGALWLKTTAEGDEEDRVLRKGDGSFTYLGPDVAYHEHKFRRGYDLIVDLFGADHHNYAIRLRSAVRALGYNPDKLRIVIYQLVTVRRGEQIVRFSKRSGDTITLKEMLDGVGNDALRFFFNLRKSDSHMEFDWDLAREQSSKNPVYYVQYAHARCCSIERKAREMGMEPKADEQFEPGMLSAPVELNLIRTLLEFPRMVEVAATSLEPHHFATYARQVAEQLNGYFTAGNQDASLRVLQQDHSSLTQARLTLIRATRQVIHNALQTLGVSAPESM
jgi:arginyl-tRNA synthetase